MTSCCFQIVQTSTRWLQNVGRGCSSAAIVYSRKKSTMRTSCDTANSVGCHCRLGTLRLACDRQRSQSAHWRLRSLVWLKLSAKCFKNCFNFISVLFKLHFNYADSLSKAVVSTSHCRTSYKSVMRNVKQLLCDLIMLFEILPLFSLE